jgi:membrane associated rhomboid family serine protease
VAINVAVFLLTLSGTGGSITGGGNSELQAKLALYGPAVHYQHEYYRLVTSGFIHYGFMHIIFNMVILYRFGELLEPALGGVRLAFLYTASLLCGSFGALLLSPHALTGGASGAVFGLISAAAIGLHQRGVNVWQSGVGGLIVVNLVLTFLIPGISIGGHLGGLAGGFICGWFMLRAPTTRRSVIDGALVASVLSAVAFAGSLWAAGL